MLTITIYKPSSLYLHFLIFPILRQIRSVSTSPYPRYPSRRWAALRTVPRSGSPPTSTPSTTNRSSRGRGATQEAAEVQQTPAEQVLVNLVPKFDVDSLYLKRKLRDHEIQVRKSSIFKAKGTQESLLVYLCFINLHPSSINIAIIMISPRSFCNTCNLSNFSISQLPDYFKQKFNLTIAL